VKTEELSLIDHYGSINISNNLKYIS